MSDAHVSFRLPDELARALDQAAERRGVPRSLVVREAVSEYLVGPTAPPESRGAGVNGADLAAFFRDRPKVAPEEAAEYERAIRETLDAMPPLDDPWA